LKITQEEVVDLQTVLNIELEEDDLPPYLDRGYQRVVNRVSIPGFRKGKAPRTIVENFLGKESLIREALDFMVSDVTEKAFSERNIETAGPPDVELLDLDPVIFKATVALKPIVDLGNYRGIRVPETPPEVKDEDVANQLEALRHESASWEPVDRAVALGDMVTMDVTATVEDSEILNESDTVYLADAENEMPFPGLPQRLEGAEVGVVREFDLEIPSDYGSDQIAGKTARFVVTVNDVKERKLPELDDEFAKGVGDDCDTLDALRESVRDQLQAAAEESAERLYKEAAVDELLANATVELAPLSVDREIDRSMGHRARLSEMLGVPVEDFLRQFGTTEEEVRQSTRETAVRDLTRSYALATLAEAEGLEVADDEVEEQVREILAADGGRRQGSRRQDRRRERDRLRAGVEAEMMETKSLGRLVDIAKGGADTDAADHEEQGTEGERVDT
jgi:trigger factor